MIEEQVYAETRPSLPVGGRAERTDSYRHVQNPGPAVAWHPLTAITN